MHFHGDFMCQNPKEKSRAKEEKKKNEERKKNN